MATTKSLKHLSYERTLGMTYMEGKGFYYPNDAVVSPEGKIYVLNRGQEHFGSGRGIRVTVLDTEENFHSVFGKFGSGYCEFTWPSAISMSPDGRLFITDEHLNKVIILNSNGDPLGEWGKSGEGNNELNSPSGITFDNDGNVYISDTYNNCVKVFTDEGKHIQTIGKSDGEDGLNLPWRLSIGPDSNIYVADWGNDRICSYDKNGNFISAYGKSGLDEGQLLKPADVVVDKSGNVYACDWGNERIQVFSNSGDFLEMNLGESKLSGWANDFFSVNAEEAQTRSIANLHISDIPFVNPNDRHEISSHIEEYFWGPSSLNIGPDGKLYITEVNRHRIQVFNI
jgi:sugar lactone lactonase YvrE